MYPVGPTWTIDLTGAELAKPVTIELPFGAASLPAGTDPAELLLAYRDDATSRWVPVPATVDAATGTVKADVSHLSIWGLFAPDWNYWLALLKTATSGNVTTLLHGLTTFASGCTTQAGIYTIDNSAANKMIEGCLTETSPTAAALEIRNLRAFALEVTDPRGYIPKQPVLLMPGDAVPFTVTASDAQPVIAQADMSILGLTASVVDIVLGLLPNISAARLSPAWRAAFTEIVDQVDQLHDLSAAISEAEASHYPQAAEAAVKAISGIDFLTTLATASHAAGVKYGIPALAQVSTTGLQRVMVVVGLGDLIVTSWSFFGDYFFNAHIEVTLSWKLLPPPAPTDVTLHPGPAGSCGFGVCDLETVTWAALPDPASRVEVFSVAADPLGAVTGHKVTCTSALAYLVSWLKTDPSFSNARDPTYGFNLYWASSAPGATSVRFSFGGWTDYEGQLCGFYVRAVNKIGASPLVSAGADPAFSW
jgi:hypothetical protein